MEYCFTPPPHHSITPSLHRSLAAHLTGVLLITVGLLVLTMTGCGPSSSKTASQSATNAVATRALAKTNQAPLSRPGVRTNLPPALARAGAGTNLPPAVARPGAKSPPSGAARVGAKTNAVPALARTGARTNAAPAVGTKPGIAETVRNLQANRAFYPAVGVVFVCLCLAVVLVVRLLKAKAAKADKVGLSQTVPAVAAKPARRKAARVAIHSCNVLQVGAQARQLWQFDSRGGGAGICT